MYMYYEEETGHLPIYDDRYDSFYDYYYGRYGVGFERDEEEKELRFHFYDERDENGMTQEEWDEEIAEEERGIRERLEEKLRGYNETELE